MIAIRLKRMGAKKRPYYRIVVSDSRKTPTGRCIAELGTMIPRAGGQYAFARRALGDYAGLVVGISDWLSTCGSAAVVALVIGEYLSPAHAVPIAVAITLFFALLQILGVRVSARVQEYTSLLKTLAFALLIAACFALNRSAAFARAELYSASQQTLV